MTNLTGKDKALPCLNNSLPCLKEEDRLYRSRYRIASTRLQTWDYGWNVAYFVTICTKNRENYFGEIIDGEMVLSEIGETATKYWMEIPYHFPFVKLGAYITMPNHIHGIVVIDKPDNYNRSDNNDNADNHNAANDNDVAAVETTHALSLQSQYQSMGQKRFQNQGKNTLSSIIGSYKSVVTKNARIIDPAFAWQSRFYDHIIRDDELFYRISEYIKNNPANWDKDNHYDK